MIIHILFSVLIFIFAPNAFATVDILESSIPMGLRLFQHNPDGECGDNIVARLTFRADIKKAVRVKDFVHVKYRTTAYGVLSLSILLEYAFGRYSYSTQ